MNVQGDQRAQNRLQDFERSIFGYCIRSLSKVENEATYDVPIKAMLGRAAKSPSNVLETLGKNIDKTRLVADFKYDGERT